MKIRFLSLAFKASLWCMLVQSIASAQNTIPINQTQQTAIDSITNRLVKQCLRDGWENKTAVDNDLNTMLPDGSWSDVNYSDTSIVNWKPLKHLDKLKSMAVAYRKPGSSLYNNENLYKKIVLGLTYFSQKKPVSANWWYNQIGGLQTYMVPLLLLKGKLVNNELLRLSSYLKDVTDNKAHSGKNRAWVSEITIYKGCIENNFALVNKGFLSMASTLAVVTKQGNEGIKPDNSFHQHHSQLYSGGYGLSILGDLSNAMLLTRQTLFAGAFSIEKRNTLTGLMLNGHQLLGYRGAIDFGSVGRNITRKGSTRNISSRVLTEMEKVDPDHAAAFAAWEKHLDGGPFAAPGNKYFWNSAIMTQHGTNYYLSAKIISKRTYGTEAINGENIKGYNLPLGATNIMTTGYEYRNIFPVWDWSRIPGTTAELNQEATHLKGYQIGHNEFGGGVSNGEAGAIAFESDYNGVKAKKAYFFAGGMMYCLGAGISADKTNSIATSVNQTYSADDVTMEQENKEGVFAGGTKSYNNLKWVYHNHVGYLFPKGGNITVQNMKQTGAWKSINLSGSDSTVTEKVFSIWIDHGKTPVNATYNYIVVPDIKLAALKELAAKNNFIQVKNDTLVQAVHYKDKHIYAVVFYQPGTVKMDDGLIISADQKSMVLIQNEQGGYKISVADPIYKQSNIIIKLNRIVKGNGASNEGKYTKINFKLPVEENAGSTITNNYTIN